ncbi:hypothetical protein A2U01_0014392, partial [Trifolium medium]|nr:hypothetical protein [Trifolium medium]
MLTISTVSIEKGTNEMAVCLVKVKHRKFTSVLNSYCVDGPYLTFASAMLEMQEEAEHEKYLAITKEKKEKKKKARKPIE